MKTITKNALYLLIAILVGVTVTYAGSLTPPGSVADTMYTLDNIYNLGAGTTATLGSGTIPTTPSTTSSTFHTLTEIYTNLSTQIANLSNAKIAHGVSAFGYTGTLYGSTDQTKVLTTAEYPGTATAGYAHPAAPLKTGQTLCYDPSGSTNATISCSGTHQDGETQYGQARSYMDNGDGTITDNSTGLMWVKDPSQIPGGTWGTPGSPSSLTFANALADCDSLDYAGHTDWYLPTMNELLTSVDFGTSSPAINTTYFPNTQSDNYWSATTYGFPSFEANAWGVNFSDGYDGTNNKSGNGYVRCVRSLP